MKIWTENKKEKIELLLMVAVLYFFAHGFAFSNHLISHDSLAEFPGSVAYIEHKIRLGRFIVPLYQRLFRTGLTVPWVIGILGFVFIFLSILLTVEIFDIKRELTKVLIAIVMICNLTVTSEVGTYVNQFDASMLSLFLSLLTVYVWKENKNIYVIGPLLIALSLGIYQAYISIVLTMFVYVTILRILEGKALKDIFKSIILAVIVLLTGVICYLIFSRIIIYVSGVEVVEASNSILNINNITFSKLIHGVIETYVATSYNLINPIKQSFISLPVISRVIILIVVAFAGFKELTKKELKLLEKAFVFICVLMLPILMNVSRVISGYSHMVMHYALWMFYVFCVVLVVEKNTFNKESVIKKTLVILVFLLGWNNVITSNAVYQKKYEEQNATLSLMTRVLYQIETIENYIPGETPVVFVGKPDYLMVTPKEYESFKKVTGAQYPSVVSTGLREYYEKYFNYMLRVNIKFADNETWSKYQTNKNVKSMKSYPFNDAIKIIDGICVVKFE